MYGVLAASTDVKNVKIVLSDNCEIEVFTTKTVVSDILEENHIVVLPEENVVPNLDSEITDNSSKIVITGVTQDVSAVTEASAESEEIHLDKLLSIYNTVTEKLEEIEEEIPYETETKGEQKSGQSTSKVIKQGENGIKKSVYKVKYQNDIEIERTLVSEETIKEPVNEVIQYTEVSSRSSSTVSRETASAITSSSSSSLAAKVANITPTKKTFNTSAYTDSTCGKSVTSASYGITSSGAKTKAWYTVAAGSGYKVGTIIYIPYFKDKPNGGWFVVQDRGGAISNNKLDIYMSTYNECISFGRKNLECYVYEF